ncbi:GNAT family N-acetyltransferase [Clostridium sporogenes]
MIKKLEWDSSYWNLKIAHCIYENNDEIREYLNKEDVDIIQTQINIDKTQQIRNLENLNFRFIDLNITYCINLEVDNISCEKYIIADEKNINNIENIASRVFHNSRFNILDIKKTKDFYKLWAKKSVLGKLDDVCLIEKNENDEIEGFVTIKKISEDCAKIGLIGVNPICQNRSVGSNLISQAKSYLLPKGVKRLFVSTQGSNIRAQNFYIKNSFRVYDISVWLYLFCCVLKGDKY